MIPAIVIIVMVSAVAGIFLAMAIVWGHPTTEQKIYEKYWKSEQMTFGLSSILPTADLTRHDAIVAIAKNMAYVAGLDPEAIDEMRRHEGPHVGLGGERVYSRNWQRYMGAAMDGLDRILRG